MTGNKVRIIRGDGRILVAIAMDIDGRIKDLRGADKVQFTATVNEDDTSYIIQKDGFIEIPRLGVITVLLTPSDTLQDPGLYWYDIKAWFSQGDMPDTIVKDRLEILQSINKQYLWIS